jgi:hypothetical protein
MLAEIKDGRLKLMAETDEEKREMRIFYDRFFNQPKGSRTTGMDLDIAISDATDDDCFLFMRHSVQVQ